MQTQSKIPPVSKVNVIQTIIDMWKDQWLCSATTRNGSLRSTIQREETKQISFSLHISNKEETFGYYNSILTCDCNIDREGATSQARQQRLVELIPSYAWEDGTYAPVLM